MPCNTNRLPQQTLAQRQAELRSATARIDALLKAQKVQIKIGPQGAIAFIGIPEEERKRMTDNCIYNRIMTSGSHGARQAIAKAQQQAGRTVDRQVIGQGTHSHDGGATWHPRG